MLVFKTVSRNVNSWHLMTALDTDFIESHRKTKTF